MPRTPLTLPFNGRQLRLWRELAGLEQRQLAEACGLSRSQISRWEIGDSKPEPGALKQLVEGLASVLADTPYLPTFTLDALLDSPSPATHPPRRSTADSHRHGKRAPD